MHVLSRGIIAALLLGVIGIAPAVALDAVAVDEYGATHFSGGSMPGTVATNEVVIAGGGIKTSGAEIAGGQVIASAVHAAGTITAASATVNGQPVVLDNDPRLLGGGGGAIITGWTAFDPVITDAGGNPLLPALTLVDHKCVWRRVGNCMEIQFFVKRTTGGSVGSGKYRFHLPPNVTIDGSLCRIGLNTNISTAASTLGVAQARMYGVNGGIGSLFPATATTLGMMVAPGASSGYDVVGSDFFGLGYVIAYSFSASIPIAEWAD